MAGDTKVWSWMSCQAQGGKKEISWQVRLRAQSECAIGEIGDGPERRRSELLQARPTVRAVNKRPSERSTRQRVFAHLTRANIVTSLIATNTATPGPFF